MKTKFIVIKPNEEPKFVEGEYVNYSTELFHELCGNGHDITLSHVRISHDLYVYFDDQGIEHRDFQDYNFNLPSSSKWQNQIFGTAMFDKINDNGDSIDVTEAEMQYIKRIIFKVEESEWYTIEDVHSFFNELSKRMC